MKISRKVKRLAGGNVRRPRPGKYRSATRKGRSRSRKKK